MNDHHKKGRLWGNVSRASMMAMAAAFPPNVPPWRRRCALFLCMAIPLALIHACASGGLLMGSHGRQLSAVSTNDPGDGPRRAATHDATATHAHRPVARDGSPASARPTVPPVSPLTEPRSEEERALEDEAFLGRAYRGITLDADDRPVYPPGFRRQLVFCISPGHTGTVWLAEVMNAAHNTLAFHERQPSLLEFPALLRLGKNATHALRRDKKVPVVLEDLARTTIPKHQAFYPPSGRESEQLFYAEMSQMFIKSQADVLMDRFYDDPRYDVNVVVLRRYLPDTLKSWLAIPSTPWRSVAWPQHYSGGEYTTSHRNFAIMPEIKPYAEQDTVEMCIGYLLDYEYQTAEFARRYPRARMIDMRAEDLFAMGPEVQALYRKLAMVPHVPSFVRLRGRLPLNPHAASNRTMLHGGDITDDSVLDRALLARVRRYLREFTEAGHSPPLPRLPHMWPIRPCPDDHDPRRVCLNPMEGMTREEEDRYAVMDIPRNHKPVPTQAR